MIESANLFDASVLSELLPLLKSATFDIRHCRLENKQLPKRLTPPAPCLAKATTAFGKSLERLKEFVTANEESTATGTQGLTATAP